MFEEAFVDRRLDRRGEQIVEAMTQRNSAIVHQFCLTSGEQIGAYRFFRNPDVTEGEMIVALGQQCA